MIISAELFTVSGPITAVAVVGVADVSLALKSWKQVRGKRRNLLEPRLQRTTVPIALQGEPKRWQV